MSTEPRTAFIPGPADMVRLATCALIAFLAMAPAPAQETSVDCAEGNEPIWLCYGEHAPCDFQSPTDVDIVRFFAHQGDRVRILARGQTSGLDLRLEILDPSLQAVDVPQTCSGGGSTCSLVYDLDVQLQGIYTLVLSEWGLDESGDYLLSLERIPPAVPIPSIAMGQTVNVTIDHFIDVDFLQFEGSAGNWVRITADGVTTGFDPWIDVYGPTAPDPLATNQCSAGGSTCSLQIDLMNLQEDGTYTLLLRDWGLDEIGSVNVTLTCISANCPPPAADDPLGSSYCATNANSTGMPAVLSASGSHVAIDDLVFLRVDDMPGGQPGIFFMGQNQVDLPMSPPGQGRRCVGAPAWRLGVEYSCSSGTMQSRLDMSSLPAAFLPMAGETWSFQAWFRDPSAGAGASNTSGGLEILFQ